MEEHEKAATTEGRLEKRSLLTATGLFCPEKQLEWQHGMAEWCTMANMAGSTV